MAQDIARSDQLKAAYVLNFARFVEWPANLTGPLTLCVAGNEGVSAALASAAAAERKVADRTLVVRRLTPGDSTESCRVLFLSAPHTVGPEPETTPLLLTVSDTGGFVQQGGMIELFAENNRLRFKVNLHNVQRAGLQLSSQMLQLAVLVENGGTP